jgi:hypothetical protein
MNLKIKVNCPYAQPSCYEDIWESGGIDPLLLLNLGTDSHYAHFMPRK